MITEGTKAKAHQIIDLYKELGVSKDRVLIKVRHSRFNHV